MKKIIAGFLDLVSVLVFVFIGRSVHGHSDTVVGLFSTAAPFIIGVIVGWFLFKGWKRPFAVFPSGVVIWLSSVAVGQLLRVILGQGTAFLFILVNLAFFALTIFGWRVLLSLVVRFTRNKSGIVTVSSSN